MLSACFDDEPRRTSFSIGHRGPFDMYSSYDKGWVDDTTPNTRPVSFAQPPDRAAAGVAFGR